MMWGRSSNNRLEKGRIKDVKMSVKREKTKVFDETQRP